jgi:hypothetical protein
MNETSRSFLLRKPAGRERTQMTVACQKARACESFNVGQQTPAKTVGTRNSEKKKEEKQTA